MKRSSFFSMMAAGFLFSGILCSAADIPAPVQDFQASILEMMPTAAAYRPVNSYTYDVLDKSGKVLNRVVFNSVPKSDLALGFAGPVPVAVVLGQDGRIRNILLGRNEETPAFLNRVKKAGFLQRWNGLRLTEALNHPVDAVSGATRSSGAIRTNVKSIAREAARNAGMQVSSEEKVDLAALRARVKRLEQSVIFCQSFLDQWKTRLEDEYEVRFIYALEGVEAGDKAAAAKGIRIFKHHGMKLASDAAVRLAAVYKAKPTAANKAAVMAEIKRDMASLQKGMLDHKIQLSKARDVMKAQLLKHSRPAGMMQFRSPEAQKLEAKIQALAAAYKKNPTEANGKALRAALQEQLDKGIKAMGGFIARKEAELKKLKDTYNGIAADTDKVIEQRFQNLTK